ncbi:MAG: PilZ domain-containing protein [Lachnospiraceae bacterium]|nr:PilZ domain-containing protein [Lachnospiraceae bacterium]
MAREIDLEIFRSCKNIKIWIYIGNQVIEKDVTVAQIDDKKNMVLLNVIYLNDKPIGLDSSKNRITVVAYRENEKPMMYAGSNVKTIWNEKEKKRYYSVHILTRAVAFNRRNSFRCYVGEKVIVRVGTNRTTYEVICRDISENGFSLVFESDDKCAVGNTAHFVYSEAIGEKTSPEYKIYNLSLYGTCVRMETLQNGKFLYGFKQFSSNMLCSKYVYHKERETLKKLR